MNDVIKFHVIEVGSSDMKEQLSSKSAHKFLEDLQKAVDGYIELIHFPNGESMVLNEDGRAKGLKVNKFATEYASIRLGRQVIDLLGDVAIITTNDLK